MPDLDVKDLVEERSIFSENTIMPGRTTGSILERSIKTTTVNRTVKSKGAKPTRNNNGMEDVFTHTQVRTWSEVRVKTWEHRRTNTEGFYYRFVGKFCNLSRSFIWWRVMSTGH